MLVVGPLNFTVVIGFWSASVVLGFAFIYRPFMPGQMVVLPGMELASLDSFMSAVNLSLSSLITVSMGVQTNSALLQFAMAAEAVLGFAILTASISWLLSIYPVIEHRRSLAHQLALLHHTEVVGLPLVEELEESELMSLLIGFAEEVSTIRIELSQFPITYYFHESDGRSILAPTLIYLSEVAQSVSEMGGDRAVAATLLGGAIDDYLSLINDKYFSVKVRGQWERLHTLMSEHAREPLHRAEPRRAA